MIKNFTTTVCGVLLLLLAGCALTPELEGRQELASGLPQSVEWEAVPFFPQEEYQCGPAALATVLNWTGVEVEPSALAPIAYTPYRKGTLQPELLAAARRHGRIAYVIAPSLKSLLAEVAAGNPVIVLQNLGLSWLPKWHYAVVVGFDFTRDTIVLRSGSERRRELSLGLFSRTWTRADNWAVIILRPGQMPSLPEEGRYLDAVAGIERAQRWADANEAYRAARDRWPQSLGALIGLGNTYYGMGDKISAERAFREAITAHPDVGVAYNNLAQVLADRGRITEALAAARRAVDLGGPLASSFGETLREIEQRSPQLKTQ